jgi:hypothetical protein
MSEATGCDLPPPHRFSSKVWLKPVAMMVTWISPSYCRVRIKEQY